jgi:copper chaperone CopZ
MKTIVRGFSAAFLLVAILSVGLRAAELPEMRKAKTVVIKSSVICGSCKARVERGLTAIEGVEGVTVDLNSKNVKVKYNPDKISEQQIRLAIANMGYDADDMKKDEAAYAKLPMCCQKPMPGDKH